MLRTMCVVFAAAALMITVAGETAPEEAVSFRCSQMLCGLNVADGDLAGAAVLAGIEGDLLALD